jgi:hypothetical protein
MCPSRCPSASGLFGKACRRDRALRDVVWGRTKQLRSRASGRVDRSLPLRPAHEIAVVDNSSFPQPNKRQHPLPHLLSEDSDVCGPDSIVFPLQIIVDTSDVAVHYMLLSRSFRTKTRNCLKSPEVQSARSGLFNRHACGNSPGELCLVRKANVDV